MALTSLFESALFQRVASGLQLTEGPVWHPEGYLLFCDVPADTLYHLSTDRTVTPWRKPRGVAARLTYDQQGRLLACEQSTRRVPLTEVDSQVRPLANPMFTSCPHFYGPKQALPLSTG